MNPLTIMESSRTISILEGIPEKKLASNTLSGLSNSIEKLGELTSGLDFTDLTLAGILIFLDVLISSVLAQ